MSPTFAQRIGLEPERSAIQIDTLDEPTRVDLWNTILRGKRLIAERAVGAEARQVAEQLWATHLRKPLDMMSSIDEAWSLVRDDVMRGEWWVALNAVDAVAASFDRAEHLSKLREHASAALNRDLAANLVAYRFVDGRLASFQTTEEANAVEQALSDAQPFAGVRKHLRDATEALSVKPEAESARSAAASIHAVEAVVRAVTGANTLSDGLKKLEASGILMHPAFRAALDKLYAYASDDDGVRHGSVEPAKIDRSTAMFMLVTCSAFTSWLIDEGLRAGLLDSAPR